MNLPPSCSAGRRGSPPGLAVMVTVTASDFGHLVILLLVTVALYKDKVSTIRTNFSDGYLVNC